MPMVCHVCHERIDNGQLFWHVEQIAKGGWVHTHQSCSRRHM